MRIYWSDRISLHGLICCIFNSRGFLFHVDSKKEIKITSNQWCCELDFRIWIYSFSFLIRFRGGVSWYTVDLNLPPSKRWTAVITDKKTEVRTLSSPLNQSHRNIGSFFLLIISFFIAGQHDSGHQRLGWCFCAQWAADKAGRHYAGECRFSLWTMFSSD